VEKETTGRKKADYWKKQTKRELKKKAFYMKMSIDEGCGIYTLCEIDSQKEKTYSKCIEGNSDFL